MSDGYDDERPEFGRDDDVLTINCQCGEVFHAEERHIGRAIKCGRCGQVLGIGAMAPTPPLPGSMGSPAPAGAPMASGRWSMHRWGIAALAFVTVVTTVWLAVLLFPREEERQQAVTYVPVPQAPAEVASKPAAEPIPPRAPTPKPPVNRLKTGTNIWTPLGASGRGTLRIHNGTSYDAAVTLLDEKTKTTRRFVYIRAREMTTLSTIAPCQCRLFFAFGTDWDARVEEFRDDPSFSVFDDVLRFTESETDSGVQWATFSVTLHPVPEGKAKTTRLSKEEFERQLGRRQSRSERSGR